MKMDLQLFASGSSGGHGGGTRMRGSGRRGKSAAFKRFASRTKGTDGRYGFRAKGKGRYGVAALNALPF